MTAPSVFGLFPCLRAYRVGRQRRVLRVAKLFFAFLPVFATYARADQILPVDLGSPPNQKAPSLQIEPGSNIRVQFIHLAPKNREKYNFRVIRRVVVPDPFDLSVFKKATGGGQPAPPLPCTQRKDLTDKSKALADEGDETKVATEAQDLAAVIKQATEPGCVDDVRTAQAVIDATTYAVQITYSLTEGQELVATASRPDAKGGTSTWEVVFSTGESGKWLTTYGFVFLYDRDSDYFSAPQGDGSYKITKEHHDFSMQFTPSIFFTWLPASQANSALTFGPTAGLGFDLTSPVVSLGASLLYHYNVSLIAGGSMTRHRTLLGQYQDGQTTKENLTNDQLTHLVYAPTWFAGLTFRFGSNPFTSGTKETPDKPAENKTPTPAPTPKPTPKPAGEGQ